MERKISRMTSEEREDMLLKILKVKRDTAWYLHKQAEECGCYHRADKYLAQFITIEQTIFMLSNDDELLEYAEIWEVI